MVLVNQIQPNIPDKILTLFLVSTVNFYYYNINKINVNSYTQCIVSKLQKSHSLIILFW